jgi:hypothetical protein
MRGPITRSLDEHAKVMFGGDEHAVDVGVSDLYAIAVDMGQR